MNSNNFRLLQLNFGSWFNIEVYPFVWDLIPDWSAEHLHYSNRVLIPIEYVRWKRNTLNGLPYSNAVPRLKFNVLHIDFLCVRFNIKYFKKTDWHGLLDRDGNIIDPEYLDAQRQRKTESQ